MKKSSISAFGSLGIVLPTFAIVLGAGLIAYGGPCYIDTYDLSLNAGCTQAPAGGPSGAPCPSGIMDGLPGTCGYSVDPVTIRIGTSGNESDGQMSFTVGSDICYVYQSCTARALINLPPKWFCQVTSTTPWGDSWSAQHASGADCENGTEK